jgi:hypothetical protein
MHRALGAKAVAAAILAPAVVATEFNANYEIHTVDKAHDGLLGRRDGACQSGWFGCAASFDGGCCPNNYACETNYCYATTAGPSSACGKQGYYNCPIDSGPGTLSLTYQVSPKQDIAS